MKIEPKPSDREILAGLVERVTYQNAESGLGKMLLFLSAIHDLRRQQEAPTGPGL
jgi:hypothetical protein